MVPPPCLGWQSIPHFPKKVPSPTYIFSPLLVASFSLIPQLVSMLLLLPISYSLVILSASSLLPAFSVSSSFLLLWPLSWWLDLLSSCNSTLPLGCVRLSSCHFHVLCCTFLLVLPLEWLISEELPVMFLWSWLVCRTWRHCKIIHLFLLWPVKCPARPLVMNPHTMFFTAIPRIVEIEVQLTKCEYIYFLAFDVSNLEIIDPIQPNCKGKMGQGAFFLWCNTHDNPVDGW